MPAGLMLRIGDKLFFKESEMTDLDKIKKDWRNLANTKKQTEEGCIEAVNQNASALLLIKKKTPKTIKIALKKNGMFLECIENPTTEMIEIACGQNGEALQFVKKEDMTKKICELAVEDFGGAIKYIDRELFNEDELAVLYKKAARVNPTVIEYFDRETSLIFNSLEKIK